jgi:hypothetical protein
MTTASAYPVRVEANLDAPLSRWLWLVKWFLAIPHYVVLAFLWLAFVVLSVAAFVSILFTGRYPVPIFEFNVGVLRWTWRVQYYSYGALATDRYPPFTLAEVPDYPAHLEVAYPQRLSRGLVLVKWWLLAIPHYVIVGIFAGGALWGAWRLGHSDTSVTLSGGGLIGLLAVIAAIVLLFTGRYPRGMFDFLLGMNRWVLRVAAYASLMTDSYPPFRLDLGGHEPDGGTLTVSGPQPPAPPETPDGATRHGWSTGRVVALVVGAVLVVVSLGMFGGGGWALYSDQHRDAAGFVSISSQSLSTPGDVRLTVTPSVAGTPVFVGVGPSAAVAAYLSGVAYSTVTGGTHVQPLAIDHPGAAPSRYASTVDIWVAKASGSGVQSFVWHPQPGQWTVVALNADGSRSVAVTVDAALTFPGLATLATWLLISGGVLLVAGVAMIVVPVRRAGAAAP